MHTGLHRRFSVAICEITGRQIDQQFANRQLAQTDPKNIDSRLIHSNDQEKKMTNYMCKKFSRFQFMDSTVH